MYVTENLIKSDYDLIPKNIPYLAGLKAAAVDIETTGLSSSRNMVFLIGVLSGDETGAKVTQFLASDYEDEASVLLSFFDFIKDYDILLNYNGSSFDIPFINKRSDVHRLGLHIDEHRSVDYMRIFKTSYLPQLLKDMKLKTVEQLAGINRTDKISGKECISLYDDFVKNKDRSAGRKVLLHNFEDLSCFPQLNRLMTKIDIHHAFNKLGFPVKSENRIFFVRSIKAAPSCIKVSGIIPGCNMDIAIYEEGFTLLSDSRNDTFSLEIFLTPEKKDIFDPRAVNTAVLNTLSSVSL
ncbi:MAG: ribonuclease H-like domain-containing protein [Firmicutes bacterium]|nr:ribonuclease H-like domain-containing protein [Bacillota bacterium]